jgi:hypothetical protein
MRFKPVTLKKIEQIDALIVRVTMEVNRGTNSDQILDTLEHLKSQLDDLRNLVDIEHDEFEKQ